VKQAAIEIGTTEEIVKRELGMVLLELEARVDEQIRERLKPTETKPEMTEAEREEALAFLRDPKLVERIVADLDTCGLVGEETNKLLAYLATVSRKLEEPLAVIVQSSSAAGKSSLMDAILAMVPAEERVSYSTMTGQALYYLGQKDLKHKVLSVAEGEGADRAAYALKLLQSEGQLTIASTGKDPVTGKLVTHEYHVTGPVMTFMTTTAIEVDDELMNRCLVLTVDEGQDQTRRVHARQRTGQTLAGLLARRERDRIVRVHRNGQRLLRPVLVVNPFAEDLTFTDLRTRTRRDHMKYLTLIRAVALLHQQQRDMKLVEHDGKSIEYIEVTAADVELATRLLGNVLDQDEMPPVTGNVLTAITTLVESRAKETGMPVPDVSFTQRELREHVGVGHTQLKTHLGRLVELEYVRPHRTAGRAHGYVYSLCTYDASRSGSEPRGRGVVGPWSGVGPTAKVLDTPKEDPPFPSRSGVVQIALTEGRTENRAVGEGRGRSRRTRPSSLAREVPGVDGGQGSLPEVHLDGEEALGSVLDVGGDALDHETRGGDQADPRTLPTVLVPLQEAERETPGVRHAAREARGDPRLLQVVGEAERDPVEPRVRSRTPEEGSSPPSPRLEPHRGRACARDARRT